MRRYGGVTRPDDGPRRPAGLPRRPRGRLFAGLGVLLAVALSAAGCSQPAPGSASPPESAPSAPPPTSAAPAPRVRPAPPNRRVHAATHEMLKHAKGLTLLSATSGPGRHEQVDAMVAGLRLVNYYPAAEPWTRMWSDWQPAVLDQGFARIAALGANAVRIIVFPDTFGWPVPSTLMATRFRRTLGMAAAHGLGVQLTLFDLWHAFSAVGQSRAWLRSLLQPYSDDPEIQLVEIKNEVDPTNAPEVGWLRALLPTLHSVLPFTSSTVSVSGKTGPAGFSRLRGELRGIPLDVADIHFYGATQSALGWMEAAKRAAVPLPLFIGEAGFSATNATRGQAAANAAQAHWYSLTFAAARAAGAGIPAPWTLNDFSPGTVPGAANESSENHFGLYTTAGQPRPAALVVKDAFAA